MHTLSLNAGQSVLFAVKTPTNLWCKNSLIIYTSLQNPNLFQSWKYIPNQLLFKLSWRVLSSTLTNRKQYFQYCRPLPAVTSCQRQNLQPSLTSCSTGTHFVFSTNNLFSELWTGSLSWWKCHWPDLKSAGLFRLNLFLNSLKTLHSNLNTNPNCLANQLWSINFLTPLTPLIILHRLPASLNLLCHSKTDARFIQDGQKAVWSIPYVPVTFFPSLKQNFIAYHSSKVSSRPDCIFEIHQLWQLGFSKVYSNCCCSCSFEPKIIKIGEWSHKMYSNNIVTFQESTTILNACIKKSGNLLKAPHTYKYD